MIPALGKKATGYLVEFGDGRIVREVDTFTCQHCNSVGKVRPFQDAEASGSGAICHGCGGLVCIGCVQRARQNGVPRCDHIERKLERQERSAQFHRDLTGA